MLTIYFIQALCYTVDSKNKRKEKQMTYRTRTLPPAKPGRVDFHEDISKRYGQTGLPGEKPITLNDILEMNFCIRNGFVTRKLFLYKSGIPKDKLKDLIKKGMLKEYDEELNRLNNTNHLCPVSVKNTLHKLGYSNFAWVTAIEESKKKNECDWGEVVEFFLDYVDISTTRERYSYVDLLNEIQDAQEISNKKREKTRLNNIKLKKKYGDNWPIKDIMSKKEIEFFVGRLIENKLISKDIRFILKCSSHRASEIIKIIHKNIQEDTETNLITRRKTVTFESVINYIFHNDDHLRSLKIKKPDVKTLAKFTKIYLNGIPENERETVKSKIKEKLIMVYKQQKTEKT